MKNLYLSIVIALLIFPSVYAQSIPQGMKYQAVARDLNGEVLINEKITIKITLHGVKKNNRVHYVETFAITTNQLGMFSLIIGEGKSEISDFNNIPWSTEEIWMNIALKNNGSNNFTSISDTKLLTVPYAFHAGTASKLSSSGIINNVGIGLDTKKGVPSQVWSLKGNSKTNSVTDRMGTTDEADLVLITNSIEKLRITANENLITPEGVGLELGGHLKVKGDNATIDNDLFVGRNVVLNNNDSYNPKGQTINHGNFTVEDMSATLLTGILTVNLDGTFEDDLTVKDTLFAKTLAVKNLNVKENLPDGEFLATFENTNNKNGDGIKIKLGKTHPAWDANKGKFLGVVPAGEQYSESSVEILKGWAKDGDTPTLQDILDLSPRAWLVGSACDMVEQLREPLNERLIQRIGKGTLLGETKVKNWLSDNTKFQVPANGKNLFPKVRSKVCDIDFPSLTFPVITFTDVKNTLTSSNEFISFTDNEDRELGYISAMSVSEWFDGYFDYSYLVNFISEVVGIDAAGVVTGSLGEINNLASEYNTIGVEYGSGHGDYAEWLERVDAKEVISRGDIVAVKGGKITKNLNGAEQIMAVSEHPIILGNIPEAGSKHLGNNVAFMGQIPVKIMGPVATGDYIVGKGKIPGYGVAISPEDMTIEDFNMTVGRSWDENFKNGPKMVNTVVGVHNGDYFKILQKYEQKFIDAEARLNVSETRLNAVENKVNLLLSYQNLSSN